MSLSELQAELHRLAVEKVRHHVSRCQIAPQLVELARNSGRSHAWVKAAFESWCEDISRGRG